MNPDFDTRRWTRDFALAGALVGAGAPSLVVGFLVGGGSQGWFGGLLLAAFGLVGGSIGALAGWISCGVGRLAVGQELWTVPYGFILGGVGGASGTSVVVGMFGLPSVAVLLAATATGLVFGLFWMPYYALKLRGRSGLALVGVCACGSPVAGGVVMAIAMLAISGVL